MWLQYDDDGPEPEFYSKQMNENVRPEVESFKRAQFTDGLGKQDMTRSITTIQYWLDRKAGASLTENFSAVKSWHP